MSYPYDDGGNSEAAALQKIAQELENINQTLREIYTRMGYE